MNRRVFGMTVLGVAAAARSSVAQPPSWSQFKPQAGSLKEKMHSRQPIRTISASVDATRSQLQEIIKQQGRVDLFSLDSQHRPLPDERDLVKFCKLAEELGVGVQLRIQHPKWAYLTGRYADLGVLAVMVPLVEDVETANDAIDDIERHSNSPFKSLEEVHAFVIEQLKGYDVRLPAPGTAGA